MAQYCSNVLATGTCSNAMCPFEHNVQKCELCSLVFRSGQKYQVHLKSKQHQLKARGETGALLYCSVCDKRISGMASWKRHVGTLKHQRRAKGQVIQPEEPETVPNHQFCVACNRHIYNNVWAKHLLNSKHKDREQFLSFQSAVEEAEKDKNGIAVQGTFDFEIVELPAATAGVSGEATIRTSIASSRINLVEYTLASSKGRASYSPFSVSILGSNRVITYGSSLKVLVKMRQCFFGRHEDRLELVFEDLQLKKRFIIARTLRVIVGSKDDHNNLRPKVPYVPRKRSAINRQPEYEVVEGEMPPSTKAIPYIGALPQSKIPGFLERSLGNGNVKEVVDHLQKVYLPRVLNGETYGKHFKHLLWAEEFQMERDLEHYDMSNTPLTRHNNYYYLTVPGLAEKRPSVLVGDRILVQRNGSLRGHWFEGGVHVVRREEVALKFHFSFPPGSPTDRYSVRFKLNRIPLRRQHHALDAVFTQDRVLFPSHVHLPTVPFPPLGNRTFNALIATNARQMQAVTSIVRMPPGSVPFVIFGPPGTGKTVTAVEAILQLLSTNPTARILACAPSNSAADLIAMRLRSLGESGLFRAYAPSRAKELVPHELLPFTYQNAHGHFSVPLLSRMKRFRAVVTTCISANIIAGIGIPRGHYAHIFVDEAGQATEPEVMIAIKTMADMNTNVVLSGDPKQLGPIIRSSVARMLGLELSFLERLMNREAYDEGEGYGKSVVKLTKNYRSHNAILKFPNEQFYGGDLEPCADPKVANLYLGSVHVVSSKFPIVFHAVSGKDDREASSPSFFNIDEVTTVKSLVQKLRADRRIRISDNDIGIIAPYHAQVLKLRNAMRAFADGIKVGSVEEFQGQERKVIIISTVRSSREFVQYDLRHTLGFVANPRRFNVAVTRAQSLLLIVGDPSVLSLDPLWRSFLNYVHVNGGWLGAAPSWDTREPVDPAGEYDQMMRNAARADMNAFARMMEALTLNEVEAPEEGDADFVNVDRPWNEAE
ncbi:rna helicase [Moniliophthora roreri]|nr:rna helicase [Moniliophthora roreri]